VSGAGDAKRSRGRLRLALRAGLGSLWLAAASPLVAQGSCTVNNRNNCVLGASAAYAMNLTVTTVVRLQIPSATVALGTATAAEFTAGFGTPILTPVTVRANRSWTVTFRSWTATGPNARPNKPVADLQWGTAASGPFTNLSATQVTLGTGAATAGTTVNLYLRPRYAFVLDGPGAYSLPLQLTITAP
jgi:hypothetical protein